MKNYNTQNRQAEETNLLPPAVLIIFSFHITKPSAAYSTMEIAANMSV